MELGGGEIVEEGYWGTKSQYVTKVLGNDIFMVVIENPQLNTI
jgi:hypothetical protein